MSKKTKSIKTSSSSSNKKNEYDFAGMTPENVKDLNLTDKILLDQLGLESFPNYENCEDDAKKFYEYKNYFTKLLIITAIIEQYREKAFQFIKKYKPSSENIDNFNDKMLLFYSKP